MRPTRRCLYLDDTYTLSHVPTNKYHFISYIIGILNVLIDFEELFHTDNTIKVAMINKSKIISVPRESS